MSGLRELALAKLAKAGHPAGQQVSHPTDFATPQWDSKNGAILPINIDCPAVPLPRGRDSGTPAPKAGHGAGQQAGHSGTIDPRMATARCREWRAHLMRLDPTKPLHGLSRARWGELVDDADWLFETHALRAAGDGFSVFDLFGVMPGRDGWGGVADRLRASRSLVMSADVAKWRRVINGEPESFARGLGETVRMVPIWEASE